MFLLSEFEHLGESDDYKADPTPKAPESPAQKTSNKADEHALHQVGPPEPHRFPVELLRHPDEPPVLSQIKMSPFAVGACVVFVLLLLLILIIMIAQLSSKISDMQRVMMMAMMR
jgi:hypothetical protein